MFPLYVRKENSNNIFGVFRPIYIVARIFGLFPFSVNLEQSVSLNKPFVSKVDFFIFIFHISLYAFFALFNICSNTHLYVKLSSALETGNRVVLIVGISLGIGAVLYDLISRKNVWKIFRLLEYFDQEIRVAAIKIDYNRQRKYLRKYLMSWGLMSVIFCVHSAVIYLQYFSVISFAALVASYLISNGMFTVVLSIYIFFLYNLRIRYIVLNQNLKHLLSVPRTALNVKVFRNSDEVISQLKLIADLHNILNDVIEIVNLCYSKQVMLSIGASFSFTVFTLFGIYNIQFLVDIYTDPQFRVTTVLAVWSFYYNYFVIRVLSSGSSLRSEGKYTGVIIHKYINRSNNRILIDRLMAFSQQLMHRIPEATCKLFVFDWTVLFSLISATATYLIILIQFDSSGLRVQLDSYNATNMI